MPGITTRVLQGFDDPTFVPEQWERLLREGDSVYLTRQWQRSWWQTWGRGELLLIVAEQDGEAIALAPFFAKSGMIYFVCTGFESDYLDFIGDITAPQVLDAILDTARGCVQDFEGFEFYFVSDRSGTSRWLEQSAQRLGLSCYEDDDMLAPVLDISGQPEQALAIANNKNLTKYERFFLKADSFQVQHLRDANAILSHLPEFFEQHRSRWAGTDNPSRFVHPETCALFEQFTQAAANTGWLRFTRIEWKGCPIAFHYGICYHRRYFWGPASFAIDLARRSPGKVLIRQLLLAAIEEGANTFDFGTGNQEFKLRFATHVNPVRTWSLYPAKTGNRALQHTAEALR